MDVKDPLMVMISFGELLLLLLTLIVTIIIALFLRK